jgi:hypothetical protein
MCSRFSANEQGELAVERERRARARGVVGALHGERERLQALERALVLDVVARGAPRAARAARFQRRVHELVLVVQVGAQEHGQRAHLGERGGNLLAVARVHAACGGERGAQEGADALVHERVHVDARAGGGARGPVAALVEADDGLLHFRVLPVSETARSAR